MAKADLEIIAGILRVGGDDWEYGKPYDWACTAVRVDHKTVELMGAIRAPSPSEWRAIRETLISAGFTHALIVRHKGDRIRRGLLTSE
jgi:hypothetical protein